MDFQLVDYVWMDAQIWKCEWHIRIDYAVKYELNATMMEFP